MKYNQTILQMMTTYPTLYASEDACLTQIFFTIGGSYDWNEDGEIACVDPDTETKSHRSIDSVLGLDINGKKREEILAKFDQGEDVMFYSCGVGDRFPKVWSSASTAFGKVLKGLVKPNEEWKRVVCEFCIHYFKDDIDKYNRKVDAYYFFKHDYEVGSGHEYLDASAAQHKQNYAEALPMVDAYLKKEYDIKIKRTPEEMAESDALADEIIDEVKREQR